MLHLIKLSVGPKDVAQLAALQAERLASDPPLRAWTRLVPKRRAELLDGGSIYWVVGGFVRVRQRLLAVEDAEWDDGTPCIALVLDPRLVPVAARPQKPFQGWRYLSPADAPADLGEAAGAAPGEAELPPRLRQELELLGLL
jgi:hypothetical protein